jgi:hypothetical protein
VTRVSSYEMYECDKCGQIHVKPKYSSVSMHVPWDLNIDDDFLLTCTKCGDNKAFSKFKYLGLLEKPEQPLPAWLTGRKVGLWERIRAEFDGRGLPKPYEPPYPYLKK